MSNAWTLRWSVLLMVFFSANAVRGPVTYDRPVDFSSLNYFNGSWFSDTELLYMMDYSLEMVKYNVETGVVTTVVNRTLMEALGFPQMSFSADKKWISITDDSKTIYRHSNVAKYTLVELETGAKCRLAGGQYVQVMMWAPAGHAIVFVQDNDVFYQSVHCPTPNTQRITDTPDYVFNGFADWVYEGNTDNILGPVAWADNTHFSATWMTRLQNKAYTLVCNSQDLKYTQVLEQVENKGWLTIKPPVFKNHTAFFTVLPRDQGGQNGNYRQLCLVSADRVVALTSGLDVVDNILKYDQKTGTVYYLGTAYGDSAQIHLFAVTDDGRGLSKCLTCQTICRYNSIVDFSDDASYYIVTCFGQSNPFGSDFYSKDGRFVKQLSDNKAFAQELSKELPPVKHFYIPVSNGFIAKVRLYVPSNLQEDGSIKYPVLFDVYSGPDTIMLTDRVKLPSYAEYLVNSRGVIIVNLDGRGGSFRGDNIKFEMYHKLGGPEIEDIFTVARYLQTNLPYVDAKRTAIWGWSYGGYAAAITLAKDTDQLFKCGLSVAPVTNWLYYDTAYTERYMGLPTNDSNLEGYKAGEITSRVENFRHKLFLLIHGNADDNVHYQHSMMLSKALQHADILFYQRSYPDESHALAHVTKHLRDTMDEFWTKCFQLKGSVNNQTRSFTSRRYDYISSRGFKTGRELQRKIKTLFDFI